MGDQPHRPPAVAGLPFTLGVFLILVAGWLFVTIADEVAGGKAITQLDLRLADWFHQRAAGAGVLVDFMFFISHWNGIAGCSAMGVLLALWFWYRKAHDWLLMLLVAQPGGLLLNAALKQVFRRTRPVLEDPLLTLQTYSFPSGHTAAATVFYGMLACYLARQLRGWPARLAACAACAAMVALVALSRMVLGVHYLSDVLAAGAEGAAWLAVCFTAVSALRRRRLALAGSGGSLS